MIDFKKTEKQKVIEQVKLKVKEYCFEGYHCSESAIRAVTEALQLKVSDDLIKAACGFRGGGGGYHDRCGVIEVGMMVISLIYGREDASQERWPYSYLIRVLQNRFHEEFGSIYCRDILLPLKKTKKDRPCLSTYEKGCEIIIDVLFDSENLLCNISEEEKNR